MNSGTIYAALAALSLLLAAGCGKSQVSIGKGDPEGEFKQCLKLSTKGKFEDSIQCFEMFKARYPQTAEGQEAELKIGDAQFHKKEYLLAAESYMAFLRLYPTHPKADYPHYRAGVSYYKESPKAIDRDQGYLDDAIKQLGTVVRRYPNSAYRDLSMATLNLALKRIAERYYYIGNFYFRTGEYIAAIPRFREVAADFPESGLGDISLYKVVEAEIALGRLNEAKAAFSDLSMKFPGSKYTKKAEGKLLRAVKKK